MASHLSRISNRTFKQQAILEIPITCSYSFLNNLRLLDNYESDTKNDQSIALPIGGCMFKFTASSSTPNGRIIMDLPKASYKQITKNMGYMYSNILKNKTPNFKDMQFRYFRTERDIFRTKNENIVEKFKEYFQTQGDKDKILKDLINSEFKTKEILNDSSLSKEERSALKVAFAEGYLSAASNHTPKKSYSILQIAQQLLTIFFIAVMIFMLATNTVIKIGSQIPIDPEAIKVNFDDVKGANDAKQELQEVVEFLKNPERFSRVGGKLPKGVLLVGPPGTGKTLLARALAGEAGVPFFHTCGAEFDEMLVGQGARRVRDLFKTAKENAPCVIFIDEIDAVGCKRTNTILHPHANQTVNQLLAEMDGFHPNEGVIILGATNRRDDLDPALLRPGRFDLEVTVAGPDYEGRKDILNLYLNKIRSKGVDIEILARGTPGFTGADLENLVNQAAIRAGVDGADYVDMSYLEAARDKILMGPEMKSRVPDEEANKITAYHEAGHALVAYYTKDAQPLHKVTIVARGSSLGHTAYIPDKDRYYITLSQLYARLDTLMGGRAAEELIFGMEKITSGAASDLKMSSSLATQMVKEWGMSEKAGLRTFQGKNDNDRHEDVGQAIIDLTDSEIKRILQESYDRAKQVLRSHAKEHKLLAEALLQYETLTAEQVKQIFSE